MDPYMEEPELWPDVHTSLLVALRDELVTILPRAYAVTVELRVYEVPLAELELVGSGDVLIDSERRAARGPDGHGQSTEHPRAQGRPQAVTVTLPRPVEVRERYLEIRRARTQPGTRELITVIEVLSPANKRPGKGREQYEAKRLAIAESLTNLVEVDLLRGGEPLPVLHQGAALPRSMAGDYRVVVSRGAQRHRGELFPLSLRDPLPALPIPLRPEDDEPTISLQKVLDTVYDRGGFDRLLDYHGDPVPPLKPDDAAWADSLLREKGLKGQP